MFIYQKNKVNEVTGQVEQSLNVTFEGNKPVETPDVVITKDGVTGIKSDSNAYFGYNLDPSNVSSISADGVISTNNICFFSRYFSWNTTGGYYCFILEDGSKKQALSDYFIDAGEYVIDMENATVTIPKGDVISFSTACGEIIDSKKVYGIQLGL